MKYDLHVHTKYSICGRLEPRMILKIMKKLGYNGVAIADHNTIKGALQIKKLNKDKDFEVIIGEEVKTDQGELLVYYVQEEIKKSLMHDVIDKAKQQDCIIAIAHPMRAIPWLRFKHDIKDIRKKIDAVECWNSRTFTSDNRKAEKICEEAHLAKIAGSDSHFGFELGSANTFFEGNLRDAIKKRKTTIQGNNNKYLIASACTMMTKIGRFSGIVKRY